MMKKNMKKSFIGSLNDFVHHFPLLGMVAANKKLIFIQKIQFHLSISSNMLFDNIF